LAGPDPTGIGGVLAGFGDQREIELLVEAGFTPVEAIHIATQNGAQFLGEDDRIGTLAPGQAGGPGGRSRRPLVENIRHRKRGSRIQRRRWLRFGEAN